MSSDSFFDSVALRLCGQMNILDKIVAQKKGEVAKLPERVIAAGDLRDAMLEHGERRDFMAALNNPASATSA